MKVSFFKLLTLVTAVASPFVLAAAECTKQPKTERPPRRVPSLQSLAVRVAARPGMSEIYTRMLVAEYGSKFGAELNGKKETRVERSRNVVNTAVIEAVTKEKTRQQNLFDQIMAVSRTLDADHWNVFHEPKLTWQQKRDQMFAAYRQIDPAHVLACGQTVWQALGCGAVLDKAQVAMDLMLLAHPNFEVVGVENGCNDHGVFVAMSFHPTYQRALTPNVCLMLLYKMLQDGHMPTSFWMPGTDADKQCKLSTDEWNQFLARAAQSEHFEAARQELSRCLATAVQTKGLNERYALVARLLGTDQESSMKALWLAQMNGLMHQNNLPQACKEYVQTFDDNGSIGRQLVTRCTADFPEAVRSDTFSVFVDFLGRYNAQQQDIDEIINGIRQRLVLSTFTQKPSWFDNDNRVQDQYRLINVLNALRITKQHPQYGLLYTMLQYCGKSGRVAWFKSLGAAEAGDGFKALGYFLDSPFVTVGQIKDTTTEFLGQWLRAHGDKNIAACAVVGTALEDIKVLVDWCCARGVLPHHFANIIGRRATQGSVLAAYRAYLDEKVRAYERQHERCLVPSYVTHAVCSLRARASGLRLPTLAGLAGFAQQHKSASACVVGGSGCAVSCAVGLGLLSGTEWLLPALMKNSVVGGLFAGFCGVTTGMGMVISLCLASELRHWD